MKHTIILILSIIFVFSWAKPLIAGDHSKFQNRLAMEKSPYLLQHANNPVDWYPWGEEAFTKAQKEDKPIFLSVGYSTCHWCHVMEEESFENEEIAAILNEHFVPIKVDREERPDVDNIYMAAVYILSGSGGWPMSLFLTPDKQAFAGGTYYPPESRWGKMGFKDLLLYISGNWQKNRSKIIVTGQSVTETIQKRLAPSKKNEGQPLSKDTLQKSFQGFQRGYDQQYAGFGFAPKFPSSHNLSFLLRYWKRTANVNALLIVETTLQEMAKGGIYDQIGGGFHRYSTERTWQVPHFEKMLYDQAILAKTYCEAYQATGKEGYAQIAREIYDYVLRDMRDFQGGFYSAEDADSLPPDKYSNISVDPAQKYEKSEGAFYLWREDEIVRKLGKEKAEIFNYYYGVEKNGNARQDPHKEFINKNILYVANDLATAAKKFKKPQEEIRAILQESRAEMLKERNTRPRPHLDDKILVDWNGLMISSLAVGARVLDEPRYAQAAEQAAKFILKNLVKEDGRLLHRFRDKEAAIMGTIEDYAFFVHGLVDLYELTFKTGYLKEAMRLNSDMLKVFWDDQTAAFYFTADDAEKLLVRTKEAYDGAIPSGNSIAALNLIRLARLTINMEWEKKAQTLMEYFSREISGQPNSYSQMLIALDFALGPSREIVISGNLDSDETEQMLKVLYGAFFPNKVVAFRPASEDQAANIIALVPFVEAQRPINGKTTAYVCENHMCKKPVTDLNEFKANLGFK